MSSHKQKLRKKKALRKALRNVGACMTCAPFIPYHFVGEEGVPRATWPCPKCGRVISLNVINPDPKAMEMLALVYANLNKRPFDKYTVYLDGKEIAQSAPCCDVEDCEHEHMKIELKTGDD